MRVANSPVGHPLLTNQIIKLMNRKFSIIVAAVLLLGVAFLMGSCTKTKATISPAKLSLRIGETNEVSVNFQGISSYRFEIEDTNVADFPSEPGEALSQIHYHM